MHVPGYGGWLRAVHTTDCPIIFRNLNEEVLAKFLGYDGVDRTLLRRMATEFGTMYANFVRNGDAGADWSRYTAEETAILWVAETCTSRPHLLDGEIEVVARNGITDIESLRRVLVRNTRRSLNPRQRAFDVDNGMSMV